MKTKILYFFVVAIIIGCASENAPTLSKTIPQLTTSTASNIAFISASCGGEITSDGGDNIINKGVVWSTEPSPTIGLSTKTIDQTENKSFSSDLENLSPSTKYYVKSYATNSVGTGYGNEISFATIAFGTNPVVLPTISTLAVSDISIRSAISGGNISVDGGSPITARGVVWDVAKNPTITLATKADSGTGIGNFSSAIKNLKPKRTYYTRAYATNSAGTVYGNEVEFKTLPMPPDADGTVSDADGNIYKIVKINDQVWMAENLRTTSYCDGDDIPKINFNQWAGLTTGAWTYYDDKSNDDDTYGKLYNWDVATNIKNACPCGWRVATADDWQTLKFFLGLTDANEMRSIGTIEDKTGLWHVSSALATNSVGFNAQPVGWGDSDESNFVSRNYETLFWCNDSPIYSKYYRYFQLDHDYINSIFQQTNKHSALSIRCIKN